MKVFYIAPHYFDSEFNLKFQIVKKVAKEFNFEILKGVQNIKNEFNRPATMELYSSADYFVADLSFERPSCYYEIGYAQGMNKKVFLIAQNDTVIHQVEGNITFYSDINEYKKIIFETFKKLANE